MSKTLKAAAEIRPSPCETQVATSFPVLARNLRLGIVVLFIPETAGTVLAGGQPGQYYKSWALFDDRTEWEILPPGNEIILSNKEE